MRMKSWKTMYIKAGVILPKTCASKSFADQTLLACWISFFAISQLKRASTGCLMVETVVQNKPLAALSLCLTTSLRYAETLFRD